MPLLEENKIKPFQVVCIDDSGKNPLIDESQWIRNGEIEIVTGVFKDLVTNDFSYTLFGKKPKPFVGYNSRRFRLLTDHSVN